MRYYFTEEDELTRVRGSEIRAALVQARHEVVHGRLGAAPRSGADVWLHGLGCDGGPPMADDIVRELLAFPADVVLFQLCDAESMSFYRIPEALAARTRLFLRNHWPKDENRIPEGYRDRIGWLPPMVKAMAPDPGKPLSERPGGAVFYGTRTGFANLADGKNAREETIRRMRASGLPFAGGLSEHKEARYHPSPELVVPRMSEREHIRCLRNAKICLAPWGNHHLTYRLFEGMALRCLVVAQPMKDVAFLDGGSQAGRDYVEVAADLGDLTEVVHYYLAHLDEAQRIADAGHALFRRFLASRGPLVSACVFDSTVASWRGLYRPSSDHNVVTASRGLAARLFPALF